MTEQEMKELARSAAHSAITAVQQPNEKVAVDKIIGLYLYALQEIKKNVQQSQRETTQELGDNSSKFK